jgi:hypothetical protein
MIRHERKKLLRVLFVKTVFLMVLTGCEGFKLTGTMCESLQPGEVSTECRPYSDEEAAKASEPSKDDSGECLKCNEAEEVELRR